MRTLPSWLRMGLETRVASRTFLLFAVCAVLPIVIFAVLGYQVVNTELRKHADERLVATSKNYGLLVYDRLRQADATMVALAEAHVERGLALANIRDFSTGVLNITAVSSRAVDAAKPPARISRALNVVSNDDGSRIQLELSVHGGGRQIHLVGELAPEYLWDDDAVEMQSATLCAFASAQAPLHCMDSGGAAMDIRALDAQGSPFAAQSNETLSGDWHLYLRPFFGSGNWIFRTYQPASIGHEALRRFAVALLIIAALATICALLLSSVQIRRSHQPLLALTQAARRIGRMRFNKPVHIDSGDEYTGLAQAFNSMGARLRYQFSLLSTLARVDRLILSRNGGHRVLAGLLPKLPRLLNCDVAAVLIVAENLSVQLHVAQKHERRARTLLVTAGETDLQSLTRTDAIVPLASSPIIADALQGLERCAVSQIQAAAIRVKAQLRGALILGYRAPRSARPASVRYAAAIAQRLAVAISNEEREHALIKQAYFDPLTGLPNRVLFKDRLHQELVRAKDQSSSGALLFIDVDRFKSVNDSLGHSAGDELLKGLAARFTEVKGPRDTLARLGGDEFTLIAPDANAMQSLKLAETLLESLQRPLRLCDIQYIADASIGIAMFPQDGDSAEVLLRNADLAMYRAKTVSRGQARFFEESMNHKAARRLDLEQRLRSAIANDELTLHYQPIVRSADGTVIGVEALTRWLAGDGSSIAPTEFIPIAEETGLIAPLGAWAMRAACRALRDWRAQGVAIDYIAVNVSIRQLNDPGFTDFVIECLHGNALSGRSLEIEVTESVLAENPHAIGEQLRCLRELGVRIAIDDFGTGYSSMAMLRHLHVDALKIDQSFVRECAESGDARALVEALVAVGHALDKTVIAEGVESEAQRRVIESTGCDRMQGYLFSRALSHDDIRDHLLSMNSANRHAAMRA